MKLKTTLLAAVLAMFSASAVTAFAADEKPAGTMMEKETPMMDTAKTKKKAVKRHSHVDEKVGAQPTAAEPPAAKPDPSKDKSKHYHPRDK